MNDPDRAQYEPLITVSVHLACTACGGRGLLGGMPCHCQPDEEEERDDSPYCDCGAIPDEEEESHNRCSCCGKRIDP